MTTIQPSGRLRDVSLEKLPVAARRLTGAHRQNTITGFVSLGEGFPDRSDASRLEAGSEGRCELVDLWISGANLLDQDNRHVRPYVTANCLGQRDFLLSVILRRPRALNATRRFQTSINQIVTVIDVAMAPIGRALTASKTAQRRTQALDFIGIAT
jgi:hypothetical protein